MPFFQTHSKSLIFYLQNPELYSPTIIFMMIAIIIVTAGYGNRQIIVIDKKYFKYCSNQNLWFNYQQFYLIIFNWEPTFDIQIPLVNIAKIALSYSDIEAQGVKIQDPYHLKEALANKDMRFAEYIEKTSNHF